MAKIPMEKCTFVVVKHVHRHCKKCQKETDQLEGLTEWQGQTHRAWFCEVCHGIGIDVYAVLEN